MNPNSIKAIFEKSKQGNLLYGGTVNLPTATQSPTASPTPNILPTTAVTTPATVTPATPTTINQKLATPDTSFYDNQISGYQEQIRNIPSESSATQELRRNVDATIKALRERRESRRQEIKTKFGTTQNIANASQIRSGLAGSGYDTGQNLEIANNEAEAQRLADQELALQEMNAQAQLNEGIRADFDAAQTATQKLNDAIAKSSAEKETARKGFVSGIGAMLLAEGRDPNKMDPQELLNYAQTLGTTDAQIKASFKEAQQAQAREGLDTQYRQAQINKANRETVGEGQTLIQYDSAGNIVSSSKNPKTYKSVGTGATSGTRTSNAVNDSAGTKVSAQAQNILDQMNVNGGSVDDYIKGSSISAQNLRNEVYAALNAQGGRTQGNVDLLNEAKALADEMIQKEDFRQLGYSARLGGQYTTGFGDMVTRAQNLNALLAKDNLGLLKGAMSDKDLQFIEDMSGGVATSRTISEDYAKQRMESIQKRVNSKLTDIEKRKGNAPTQDPAMAEKIKQAKAAGYTDAQIQAFLNQ